jgi:chemotaxis protein CheC
MEMEKTSIHPLDTDLLTVLNRITAEGARNAASGLTEMVGQSITVKSPEVSLVSLFDLPSIMDSLEDEAIGIYLRVESGISGQIMLVMPFACALDLVDLLLDNPPGTSKELGHLERSALGEVGNLIGSFFLNTFSQITGCSSRPTPPAVMVDMLGAILDIIIASAGYVCEEVILLRSTFANGDRSLETSFWVIPDPGELERLYQADREQEGDEQ